MMSISQAEGVMEKQTSVHVVREVALILYSKSVPNVDKRVEVKKSKNFTGVINGCHPTTLLMVLTPTPVVQICPCTAGILFLDVVGKHASR